MVFGCLRTRPVQTIGFEKASPLEAAAEDSTSDGASE